MTEIETDIPMSDEVRAPVLAIAENEIGRVLPGDCTERAAYSRSARDIPPPKQFRAEALGALPFIGAEQQQVGRCMRVKIEDTEQHVRRHDPPRYSLAGKRGRTLRA